METIPSFGNWIRKQRKALDLTQKVLADRVGCSVAAIKKIEGEERRPSRQIAERLADILGVPTDQRETFIDVARGIKSIEQLFSAHLENRIHHNLPVQLTSFIGRKQELTEVKSLLLNTRLLTLIGPGGTGKTRLALQIGQETLPTFADGVWLVELAPLTDASLIPQTIASVFELREAQNTPLMVILVNYLRTRQLLLILDNCEHLVAACAKLAVDLLHTSPRLKILVSSREALGVSGETIYRVPSLSLPELNQTTLDAVTKSEAAQLLTERAQAVQPRFVMDDTNVAAISQICNRLDGIPLALELAAARMAVFSPEDIASHLDDRFRLLTGGSRSALERHQTLRALIDWSFDLLSAEERKLFCQTSVFSGGWTFEAAEAVFSGVDVLYLLPQLVKKSLVLVNEHGKRMRYHLPETIRQYAREKFLDLGGIEAVRDCHLRYFLQLAQNAEPQLRGHEQIKWLSNLEAEHDNLRAALSWSIESNKKVEALQMAGALYYYWGFRGHWFEGKKWFDSALALTNGEQLGATAPENVNVVKAQRAKTLYGAAWMTLLTLGATEGFKMAKESLSLWREVGDKWWIAVVLELVGLVQASEGDFPSARIALQEGVSLAMEINDPWALATCLVRLGDSVKGKDLDEAREYLERGIAAARITGDRSVLSEGLRELGSVCMAQGELATAMQVTEEALTEARTLGSFVQILLALFQLVMIACLRDELNAAKAYCEEFWSLGKDNGNPMVWLFAPLVFGFIALYGGNPGKGVRLLAAADVIALQYGMKVNVQGEPLSVVYQQALEKARQEMPPEEFEPAFQGGQHLTLEQAIALAID